MNHAHRRMLKARERTVESFSKSMKAKYIKDIQDKERREAIKRKIAKSIERGKKRRNEKD